MRSCQVVGCPHPAHPQRTVIVDDQVELEVAVCLGHVLPGELWTDQPVIPDEFTQDAGPEGIAEVECRDRGQSGYSRWCLEVEAGHFRQAHVRRQG